MLGGFGAYETCAPFSTKSGCAAADLVNMEEVVSLRYASGTLRTVVRVEPPRTRLATTTTATNDGLI